MQVVQGAVRKFYTIAIMVYLINPPISVVTPELTLVTGIQEQSPKAQIHHQAGLVHDVVSVAMKINRNVNFRASLLEYQGTFIFVEIILCQFTLVLLREDTLCLVRRSFHRWFKFVLWILHLSTERHVLPELPFEQTRNEIEMKQK